MELVSVIIPTYNRERCIISAVQSVLNQTYGNFEIIIVDDASTDHTIELLKEIKDTRVRIVCLEKNGGVARARNEGAGLAKGEYLAFEDSDDLWYENKLQLQMEYLREHPKVDMVYSPFEVKSDKQSGVYPYDDPKSLCGDIYPRLLLQNTIGAPTMVIRRATFLSLGGFDTSYTSLEDWDFAIRYSKHHRVGYVSVPLVLANYEGDDHLSQQSASYYKMRIRMIVEHKDALLEQQNFDIAVRELFEQAEKKGILSTVKNLFMAMLQQSMDHS